MLTVGKYLRQLRELGFSGYVELAKYESDNFPGEYFYRYEAGVAMGLPPRPLCLSEKEYPATRSPYRAMQSALRGIEREQRRLRTRSLREALEARLDDE